MEGERVMFRKRPQSKLGRGKRTQQVGKGSPRSPLPTGGADYRPCGRGANPRGAGTEVVIPSRDLQQEWRAARWGTAKPLGSQCGPCRGAGRDRRLLAATTFSVLAESPRTVTCVAEATLAQLWLSQRHWRVGRPPVQCLSFSVRL